MDPIKAKFYQASFEISNGKEALELKGLVSEQGVTKIYIPSNLPPFWIAQLGQTVTVTLDSLVVKAVLLQQFVENGSFFELRFRGIDENQRNFIRQRITSEGISPGWQRKYPRISVGAAQDPDLPVPSLCMIHFGSQEIFVNVINFTLGGLRVETVSNDLHEVRVGSLLSFDLVTTTGVIMPHLAGEVRNMAELENDRDGGKKTTRAFGIRFVNWDPINERKYHALIKDYCLEMQKRLTGE